jgi:dTDP-4-dehydrorhamnose reductase
MRIFVVGGNGLIGSALVEAFEARGDLVFATTRRQAADRPERWFSLDLTDPGVASSAWPDVDVAFLCAGMTTFAACRAQPELAYRTNVVGVVSLATALATRGTRVVLLSSSAVFDGLRPRTPLAAERTATSIYGRLSAEAEVGVLALGPRGSVVRLTKILTEDSPLLRSWMTSLEAHQPVHAFADHRVSPITLQHAVRSLVAVADCATNGVFHVTGSGDISYADIARELARLMGVADTLVHPIKAVAGGIPAEEVLAFTSLEPGVLPALTGLPPPEPLDVVRTVLERALHAQRQPRLANNMR